MSMETGEAEDSVIQEVRHSLRDLLKEVEEERHLSQFARQAVDQEEIGKLFSRKRKKGKKRGTGES